MEYGPEFNEILMVSRNGATSTVPNAHMCVCVRLPMGIYVHCVQQSVNAPESPTPVVLEYIYIFLYMFYQSPHVRPGGSKTFGDWAVAEPAGSLIRESHSPSYFHPALYAVGVVTWLFW
jgi:hypothetical protein